jgi:hypothetical protein
VNARLMRLHQCNRDDTPPHWRAQAQNGGERAGPSRAL